MARGRCATFTVILICRRGKKPKKARCGGRRVAKNIRLYTFHFSPEYIISREHTPFTITILRIMALTKFRTLIKYQFPAKKEYLAKACGARDEAAHGLVAGGRSRRSTVLHSYLGPTRYPFLYIRKCSSIF